MSTRMYGPEEKAKLERLINEGSTVLREIEDLKEGLKTSILSIFIVVGETVRSNKFDSTASKGKIQKIQRLPNLPIKS